MAAHPTFLQLGAQAYGPWETRAQSALLTMGYYDAVFGQGEPDAAADMKALAAITSMVDDNHLNVIRDARAAAPRAAKAAWAKLRAMHRGKSLPRQQQHGGQQQHCWQQPEVGGAEEEAV